MPSSRIRVKVTEAVNLGASIIILSDRHSSATHGADPEPVADQPPSTTT